MKKKINLFLSFIFCIIFILSCDEARALSIQLMNYTSLDFGSMNAGETKFDVPSNGLIVRCSHTSGKWTLSIRDDYPLGNITNPASTIPNTNFKWYGVSTSDPSNTSLVTTHEDFTTEKQVYRARAGELSTDITMKFELILPPFLQSGTYKTNVVFTLESLAIE